MPDAIEPQLDELRRRARRRLIGAIVLALAAAVIVPMLLESDPKPLGEDVSVKIPPVDDGKFVSKLGEKSRAAEPAAPPAAKAPAAPKSLDAATVASAKEASRESSGGPTTARPPAPETAPASPPPTMKPPAKEATGTPAKESAPSSDARSTTPTASAPPKPPTAAPAPSADAANATKPSAGAFSVQLAAFADDKGANALVNRLKKAGHPAYTEGYTTSRGTLWRVRVGPYGTRDAAEAALTKLKADGQNGIIAAAN